LHSLSLRERDRERKRESQATPVILATWEAEIKRIVAQDQPGKIVQETLSQKYKMGGRWEEVVQTMYTHISVKRIK
jgi:hypothetical protein